MDLNTIKTVSVIAIGVLILVAILFATIIRKVVTKILMIVVVLGLAAAIWWQRDQLGACATDCSCTFFGIEVKIPSELRTQCTQ